MVIVDRVILSEQLEKLRVPRLCDESKLVWSAPIEAFSSSIEARSPENSFSIPLDN
jgi:hypothetical protein